ncbi:MAG: O-antigen ligase family protein [Anaerolineae bacterium]|nr:O-antigen ligase family protein [Anaerolineae bacterium]
MRLAAALVLLMLAIAYSVKSAQGTATFKDVVLAASLMWPVAVVFYGPLLDLRNPVWIVLGGLALLWILKWQRPIILQLWPVVIFFVYMMAASLWAVNSTDSALRTIGNTLLMVYVAAQVWTRSPQQTLLRTFDVLTIVSLGILILLLWGAAQEGLSLSRRFRMDEIGLKATGIASFALTALIVLGGRGFKEKGIKRLVVLALSGVALVLMVLTQTRGTLFAFIGIIAFLAVFQGKSQGQTRDAVLYLMILSLLVLFSFIPDVLDRHLGSVATYFRLDAEADLLDDPEGWAGRFDLWTYALEKAAERPFLGRGTGSSTYALAPDSIFASSSSTVGLPYSPVHSQYVETYYDHGYVGLGFLIIILLWITWAAVRAFQNPPPGLEIETKTLALLWITTPIGMVSHGGYFSSGNPQRMWLWLAGLAMVYVQQHTAERREQVAPAPLHRGYSGLDAKALHSQMRRRL